MLSRRQQALYTDTVNIYAPQDPSFGSDGGASDEVFVTPLYMGVACHFEGTPNVDTPQIQGQTKETNIFTDDKFHFPAFQPIHTGWYIQMTAKINPRTGQPHPLAGTFWSVQGEPEYKNWHAGKLMVYGVVRPAPNGAV